MQEKQFTVAHAENHEFELATLIVQQASRFSSVLYITMGDKKVNAKSIMGMTYLSLMDGDKVTVTADGPDEQEALAQLEKLIEA